MAFRKGMNAKVTLASATVVGMGNWRFNGIATDLLETTSFGDTAKKFETGLLDYGTITFAGLYDPADTTGQRILESANLNNSRVTVLRLYVDNTSYWIANMTADSSSGAYITSMAIGMDKSGLGTIEFEAKATGPWLFV